MSHVTQYVYISIFLYISYISVGLQSALGTLNCNFHAKVRWFHTSKCNGVPYKEETLKCDGLTRQSTIASPIRKKRQSAIV